MRTSCFVVILIALLAGHSLADEEDAKSVYEKGKIAFALGRFGEAADFFERAFEKKPDPAMLYNAAQARRLAGDKKKALILYQNYLRMFGEPENSNEVERRISELKAAIDAEQKANTNPPTGLAGDKTESTPATAPRATEPAPPAAVVVAQPTPEKPRPKRAWIWGVVAGGVVVVGGAIALGIVLGSTHKDPAITLGSVAAN
jgi:tetratricopeptide (TPR) repeat protein